MSAKAQRIWAVLPLAVLALSPTLVLGQGCEPIRFITPIDLGGQGQAYQERGQWRLTLGYRGLHSDQFFVGTEQNPSAAPGGQSPVINVHTLIADAAYAITDQFRIRLTVPFSIGSITRRWPDSLEHEQNATGIGDMNLLGEFWLWNPKAHEKGNLAIGLGIKAPTGSHTKPSQFYLATGPVDFPADQTIQPSDGGWGFTLQTNAFQRLTEGVYGYFFGSYMASPKTQSDVTLGPVGVPATLHWSVPDIYSVRLGAAVSIWPSQGVTLSVGGRFDGIPKYDLFGGGDSTTIKRTSNIVYFDPGLSLNRGKSTFTLSVPIRVYVNRYQSAFEETQAPPLSVNGGGFAKYLLFASYSYRL